MRGVRSLIALVVVAAGLGAYLYFVEAKKEPGSDKKLEKVFTGVAADKIDQLTIKPESGDRTTVQKQSGSWQLTQPVTAKADEAEVSGITSGLSSLEVQRVVDEKPADLKEYGLAPPRIEVSFKAGGQSRALQIGQKTPTGTDLYAKVPDNPRVFLISSYLDSTFNRSTFDLRDKGILRVERDKVESLEITTPDHELKFAKNGPEWKIASPTAARADFSAVEGLVGRLNTAQMKALTAQNATDLKEYGLDKPDVVVKIGAGSAQASLAIGKSAGEGVVYAKDMSRPMVFTIESALADELKKGVDDYRLKDLFDARSFNTTRVQVVRNGQTLAFEKNGDKWKQVSPAAKDADGAKIDSFISAVSNARAASFVDSIKDTGLDKPELTVTLKTDEGKQEQVSFARHESDVFAQRGGEPGAAKVDSATYDGIVKALDALK
ncbi:MAG: hypothetical protein DMF85_12635 [Acidobacteria bacterium]|nr:MAG: hypothetical protein DMF85_12635 [Acidobacteriota bacterium]